MDIKVSSNFERSVTLTSNILMYVGMSMLLTMMFLGSFDVMGRYFFNSPISGTLEVFEILLPGVVLFSLAATQLSGGHVTIGLLYCHLRPKTRATIDFVTSIILILLFLLITWQEIHTITVAFQQHRMIPNIKVPIYLPMIIAPIGTLAICPVLILQMIRGYKKMTRSGEPD